MIRFLYWLIAAGITACNEQSSGVLDQAPYGKISDSIIRKPNDAALHYRRGTQLYQNKEVALAEQDLKKAWALQPTEEHALAVVAVLIYRNRDEALRFLEQALQQLPGNVALQLSLARGYQQKGDSQKAVALCDQVLQLHPNALDAWVLQSEIYKEQNNQPAALAALEHAYTYAPFDVALAYQLAFEYAEGKNPKALALADSLIRMDTSESHAEPYYLKGVYHSNTGNAAQALRHFDEAMQHDYNFLDAYMEKGVLLYKQKRFAEALKTFQLALSITPSFADAWLWSGKCQEALNNRAAAKLDYQRAYGLDKTLSEAREAANKL